MLSYDLAKELKDAGFPQPNKANIYPGDYIGGGVEHDSQPESIYAPTLEELIEACGEDFDYLILGGKQRKDKRWIANSHMQVKPEGEYIDGRGSTPTKAVTRLYIALNPKAPK